MFTKKSPESDGDLLRQLIVDELRNVHIEHWGYFFPCSVAAWRFIIIKRPNSIGELKAGYDSEPYFEGKGAEWFCEVLMENNDYLDIAEEIMRNAVINLPDQAKFRGFIDSKELIDVDTQKTENLANIILKEIDQAKKNGNL